jgi:hypothetical protein
VLLLLLLLLLLLVCACGVCWLRRVTAEQELLHAAAAWCSKALC